MLKIDEISDPKSCWNKAKETERVFILLARDKVASEVILFWAHLRVVYGLNSINDVQITEAIECAAKMREEREK